jgi:hypothetical protein
VIKVSIDNLEALQRAGIAVRLAVVIRPDDTVDWARARVRELAAAAGAEIVSEERARTEDHFPVFVSTLEIDRDESTETRLHAFYSFHDHVAHLAVVAPRPVFDEHRALIFETLDRVAPVLWTDEIVAIDQLWM